MMPSGEMMEDSDMEKMMKKPMSKKGSMVRAANRFMATAEQKKKKNGGAGSY